VHDNFGKGNDTLQQSMAITEQLLSQVFKSSPQI